MVNRRILLQNSSTDIESATGIAPSNGTSDAGDSSSNRTSIAIIISIITSSLALFVLLLAFAYFFYMRHKLKTRRTFSAKGSKNSMDTYIRSEREEVSKAQVFTYKQLQSATNNFSPLNKIGHGGFGLVYRGVLPDGRLAAVKLMDRQGKQGEREFRVEVDMLTRLHSPYLLDLIGYCADKDYRLLVYSYMANGSLQEHLHSKGKSTLDWGTRILVAFDAAKGLEYLHEYVIPPIIHRDFKSSNILLDEHNDVVLADFGLAKTGADKIAGQPSTRVLGTQGYLAPEYAMTGHLTTKSDVYSYGIVLLELITGRLPVDAKRPPGQNVLVNWALPRLTDREKLAQMVDPYLRSQYNMKELVQVAAIAAMCVQPEPDYRPLITDVVQSLIPLVRQRRMGTPKRSVSSPRCVSSLLKSPTTQSPALKANIKTLQ
ncbi:probable serine/threonine-protein kinase PBL7 isoform X1 [Selaginella moellendorffii]|uniref:probable serine/threonine-protein kinase PBL7 isoform X1 n=1 Tax=Selaginella moellendorffii TaxID=88036 RepID=UPI000D1C7D1D|nr:probable serine/threonine-protein kinase PBL7 isoform X1 [Selaginella moellendorffii]|eukprot:XP_024545127.1 probable serine/threonine-protein kinase PBL7 isoform X1 [Selaginella moellendorffii]